MRSFLRQLLVLAALLGQIAGGSLAHLSMVHAAERQATESVSHHCSDHASAENDSGTSLGAGHADHSGHSHSTTSSSSSRTSCSTPGCHCACAMPPAIVGMRGFVAGPVAHDPPLAVSSTERASAGADTVFRPPI
ncbi:MAG: CopL family metal-binding regulatory protein [Steroidobacteraceae bacterium]|nr:CopL family metal-binding regulatory protein [Steroidobacteraceae bacterium]